MNVYVQMKIRSNPYLYRYLRENSYWYKYLNRNPASIIKMEEEMKEKYYLTLDSKIEDLSKKVNMISSFLDVIK